LRVSIDDNVTEEIDLALSVMPKSGESVSLERCLGGLRDDHRNAVLLAYIEGYTHEELANKLGKPLGTIKSWISRGLDELKECLET
jgi:RNA polymerase sigma-70 factor, ECF subfamily